MEDSVAIFSVAWAAFFFCYITRQPGFVAIGLTVEDLFASHLGREIPDFVHYHLRRTTIEKFSDAVLVILYVLGVYHYTSTNPWNVYRHGGTLTQTFMLFACCAALGSAILFMVYVAFQARNNWEHHPVARILRLHNERWDLAAAEIGVEVSRIDKLVVPVGNNRLVITDSWLMLCTRYSLHISRHEDVDMVIDHSWEIPIQQSEFADFRAPTQILRIKVTNVRPEIADFYINANSADYDNIKSKLTTPIRNIQRVTVAQPLSERFETAAREIVDRNERWINDQGPLEHCLACTVEVSNVKIHKMCRDVPGHPPCQECHCKPMFCFECFVKYFASRQSTRETEHWLDGVSTCPTCRARYCLFDIAHVVEPDVGL